MHGNMVVASAYSSRSSTGNNPRLPVSLPVISHVVRLSWRVKLDFDEDFWVRPYASFSNDGWHGNVEVQENKP